MIEDGMLSRREFVARATGLMVIGISGRQLMAHAPATRLRPTPITVYKSSTCGCCAKWVDHLRANGFVVDVHDKEDMDQLKNELGVPRPLRSCHTAVIGAYLIEGHVPASDLRRLLAERPKILGLAVPGMPSGTPGMAAPGERTGGYDVVAFQADRGTRTFARHP